MEVGKDFVNTQSTCKQEGWEHLLLEMPCIVPNQDDTIHVPISTHFFPCHVFFPTRQACRLLAKCLDLCCCNAQGPDLASLYFNEIAKAQWCNVGSQWNHQQQCASSMIALLMQSQSMTIAAITDHNGNSNEAPLKAAAVTSHSSSGLDTTSLSLPCRYRVLPFRTFMTQGFCE